MGNAISTTTLDAQALFDSEHLVVPPVPAHLCSALTQCGSGVFATRSIQTGPYDLEHFLNEVLRDRMIGEYAIVGLDGHGINSWYAHYYLVTDALALLVQLPWGGAFVNQETARAEIAAMFRWSSELQDKVKAARSEGRVPDGWRLAVAASRRSFAGWCWLSPDAHAPVEWHEPAGMKAKILAEVANVVPEVFLHRESHGQANAGNVIDA